MKVQVRCLTKWTTHKTGWYVSNVMSLMFVKNNAYLNDVPDVCWKLYKEKRQQDVG